MMAWLFQDPPDVVAYTSKAVAELGHWIHYVSHDEDDGAWQFHSVDGAPQSTDDARLMLLRNIVALDPTVACLADLPLGWIAWRDSRDSEWNRKQRA